MERTHKKECPKCQSTNVYDIGDRMGDAETIEAGREITEPQYPIYKCRYCGERFVYLRKE
jgi:transposase-like protein